MPGLIVPEEFLSFYKLLNKKSKNANKINIHVKGSNWGMACNTIHFLDLFSFLTREKILKSILRS